MSILIWGFDVVVGRTIWVYGFWMVWLFWWIFWVFDIFFKVKMDNNVNGNDQTRKKNQELKCYLK